ncbi:MAG: DUF3467 domain-containing protein [Acidobacteria bacterium]|nr:DUF3467 domain-containing protein [Acidobacteriota bacterium]MCA1639524.1 DUF3467 domain-containing protein [Acidobacteriota bacterium]
MVDTKTIKKEKKEEIEKRKVNIARATDYGVIYSDTVRMSLSAYDFKLTFSVNETLPDNSVLITEMITVALTPQHVKDLVETLNQNIARYEREIMPLQINERHQAEFKQTIGNLVPVKK